VRKVKYYWKNEKKFFFKDWISIKRRLSYPRRNFQDQTGQQQSVRGTNDRQNSRTGLLAFETLHVGQEQKLRADHPMAVR
jgi:hypothetical protein